MSVERINIEPVLPREPHVVNPTIKTAPQMPPQPQIDPAILASLRAQEQRSRIQANVLAMLQVVALIVSTRLLLLLSLCFAFVLAWLAAESQSVMSIGVLVAWTCLGFLPLVWLDHAARTPHAPYPSGAR